MGRIEQRFKALRDKGEKALIAFVTAGDPSLEETKEIALSLESGGADLLEIGVPFSDPTADGPFIQASSRRALKNGVTLSGVIETIYSIRQASEIPIVLFGYYNPVFAFGNERFAAQAKEAGVDGVLIVDLPMEEWSELRRHTDPLGIDFISLIAPTTSDKRIHMICRKATGFIYYVSITGVTGTAAPKTDEVAREVARIRRFTSIPVAVGFGISTPEQVKSIASLADAVVVGSALVRMIEQNSGRSDLCLVLSRYAMELKAATRSQGRP